MNNKELVQKFKDILENGDGGSLIDFVAGYGHLIVELLETGASHPNTEDLDGMEKLEAVRQQVIDLLKENRVVLHVQGHSMLPDEALLIDVDSVRGIEFGTGEEAHISHGLKRHIQDIASEDHEPEVPHYKREDGLCLSRMEMMHDGDADPEGGDLYDDAKNPEMPCPVCGKYDDFCELWGECDGNGGIPLPASEEPEPDPRLTCPVCQHGAPGRHTHETFDDLHPKRETGFEGRGGW